MCPMGCKGFQFCIWENWGKSVMQTRKIAKWLKNPSFSTDSPSIMRENEAKWLGFPKSDF